MATHKKTISKMRNLVPAVEKDLNAAGIFYASEVKKLGAKKTFIKMLEGRLKQRVFQRRHSIL